MKSKRVLKEAKVETLCRLLLPPTATKEDRDKLFKVLWWLNHSILDQIFTNPFVRDSIEVNYITCEPVGDHEKTLP